MSGALQPVVFVSHGAGPSFYMSVKEYPMMKGLDKDSRAAEFFKNMVKSEKLPRPKAILVVSAHWEESKPTVMTGEAPELLFDYGGFPPYTYKFKWPAKGAVDVAQRTKELLEGRGFTCGEDDERGYDHGVFVPLLLIYPKADIPVFQVSQMSNLSMAKHLDLGEALAELRKEGILIIGSGFATHGKSMLTGLEPPATWALNYQAWLHDTLQNPQYTREDKRKKLIDGITDKDFRTAHPRIEHFLPIAVTLAAAGYSCPRVAFSEFVSAGGLVEHYVYEK